MGKKIIEKIPVKRFENLGEAEVSPLDVDLNKAHDCLAKELKELVEHHDVMEDETGAILLDNLKHTIIAIVMAYHARLSAINDIVDLRSE